MTCLLTSAVCHLFGCCAAHVAAVLWRFDCERLARVEPPAGAAAWLGRPPSSVVLWLARHTLPPWPLPDTSVPPAAADAGIAVLIVASFFPPVYYGGRGVN